MRAKKVDDAASWKDWEYVFLPETTPHTRRYVEGVPGLFELVIVVRPLFALCDDVFLTSLNT